jgi:hypothetical protein
MRGAAPSASERQQTSLQQPRRIRRVPVHDQAVVALGGDSPPRRERREQRQNPGAGERRLVRLHAVQLREPPPPHLRRYRPPGPRVEHVDSLSGQGTAAPQPLTQHPRRGDVTALGHPASAPPAEKRAEGVCMGLCRLRASSASPHDADGGPMLRANPSQTCPGSGSPIIIRPAAIRTRA